jgi:hypothetical protein
MRATRGSQKRMQLHSLWKDRIRYEVKLKADATVRASPLYFISLKMTLAHGRVRGPGFRTFPLKLAETCITLRLYLYASNNACHNLLRLLLVTKSLQSQTPST